MAGQALFQVLDYVVFLAILALSAGVGVFYAVQRRLGKRDESTEDYLMGDRKLPLLPVTLSLAVSFISAILVIGTSSEIHQDLDESWASLEDGPSAHPRYYRGSTYWWSVVGVGGSVCLTSVLFVPVFYRLRLTSVYEYLEARYRSRFARQLGAGLFTLVTLIYLSIAIYAPSVALAAVTPFPLWLLIVLAGLVCTFYVYLGGMKAVIWTDALQAGFMMAGLIAVAVMGTGAAGGFASVIEASRADGRLIYFDASVNPFAYMTSWGIIVGQLYSWLGWYGINQSSVQRYCGMTSVRKGQAALLLNIPVLVIVVTLVCYIGLVMFAYYRRCDPLAAGLVQDRDQLLPMFVMEVLGGVPGIPGLFVACLYAGTMSTVSSGLNSLSAVVWTDFLQPGLSGAVSESRATRLTRLLTFFFGAAATGLAFLAPYLGGVLQAALSTMGAVNGPLTGMFLLGVTIPWANRKGAIVGTLVSAAVCLWLCVGAHVHGSHHASLPTSVEECPALYNVSVAATAAVPFAEAEGLAKAYGLSYVLYDMIGITLVFVVAVPVSLLTGAEELRDLNPELFHPWVRSATAWMGRSKWASKRRSSSKSRPAGGQGAREMVLLKNEERNEGDERVERKTLRLSDSDDVEQSHDSGHDAEEDSEQPMIR